jgi:hypothetical protein
MTRLGHIAIALAVATGLSTSCASGVGSSTPVFEAGVVDSQGFSAFREGDAMNVLTAVQTGLWLMPTLRYQGFVGEPDIRCSAIDLDKGEFLSDGAGHEERHTASGWVHVAYNMPVTLEEMTESPSSLSDYEGDRVLFQCRADDEAGNSLAVSYDMVLHVQ